MTIKQFKPIWDEYFENNTIEKDLKRSRVNVKNKKIFQKALWVFKESFKRQTFKGIRYLLEEKKDNQNA